MLDCVQRKGTTQDNIRRVQNQYLVEIIGALEQTRSRLNHSPVPCYLCDAGERPSFSFLCLEEEKTQIAQILIGFSRTIITKYFDFYK